MGWGDVRGSDGPPAGGVGVGRAQGCRHGATCASGAGTKTARARLYDLRSTFASNALADGITMFESARIVGNEGVKMIEQHYGTLSDTAHDAILTRLEAIG